VFSNKESFCGNTVYEGELLWIVLWENSTLLLTSLSVPVRQPLVDSGIFCVFKHVLTSGCECQWAAKSAAHAQFKSDFEGPHLVWEKSQFMRLQFFCNVAHVPHLCYRRWNRTRISPCRERESRCASGNLWWALYWHALKRTLSDGLCVCNADVGECISAMPSTAKHQPDGWPQVWWERAWCALKADRQMDINVNPVEGAKHFYKGPVNVSQAAPSISFILHIYFGELIHREN
jgi:hypothetical protein